MSVGVFSVCGIPQDWFPVLAHEKRYENVGFVQVLDPQLALQPNIIEANVHTVFPQIDSCQNFMEKHLEKHSLFVKTAFARNLASHLWLHSWMLLICLCPCSSNLFEVSMISFAMSGFFYPDISRRDAFTLMNKWKLPAFLAQFDGLDMEHRI